MMSGLDAYMRYEFMAKQAKAAALMRQEQINEAPS